MFIHDLVSYYLWIDSRHFITIDHNLLRPSLFCLVSSFHSLVRDPPSRQPHLFVQVNWFFLMYIRPCVISDMGSRACYMDNICVLCKFWCVLWAMIWLLLKVWYLIWVLERVIWKIHVLCINGDVFYMLWFGCYGKSVGNYAEVKFNEYCT